MAEVVEEVVAEVVEEARSSHDAESPAITGELELTEADLAEAAVHFPEHRWRWLLPLLAFVFCSMTLLFNHQGDAPWKILLPIAGGCSLFGYFQFAIVKKWPKRALAELGEGKMRFRFDEQGMSVDSKLRQVRYAWPALARYLEAPECFLVYPTPRSLFVVPKRAFAEAQLPQIRELLRMRIVQKPGGGGLKRVVILWLVLVVTFTAVWHFLNDGASAPKEGSPERGAPITK